MRFVFVSAFFVITLSILVWVTGDSNSVNSNYRGCSKSNDPIPVHHKEYLLQYGWHIKTICNTSNKVVNYYPELIETMQIAGLNLDPYNQRGKEAKITTYTLKEKQKNGDKLSVTIFDIDGQLIGGYGGLENWEPGVFSLSDKERLIEEGIIR